MSKIVTILLCYILYACSGCATKSITIDKELEEYVLKAQNAAYSIQLPETPQVSYKMVDSFTGVEGNIIGFCKIKGNVRTVYIKRSWWSLQNELGRMSLITHEMLHCEYNLGHTQGGLMNPTINGTIHSIYVLGLEGAISEAFEEGIHLSEDGEHNHKH